MYTIYDKQGNAQNLDSLRKSNKELYDKLVQVVKLNGGVIASYHDIMYNDYNRVIRDTVKGE